MSYLEEQKKNNNMMMVVVAVAVVALAAVGGLVFVSSRPSGQNMSTSISPMPTTAVTNDSTSLTQSEVKNGTYTAEGNYQSPGGPEKVEITLTLADGVVTDASAVSKATLAASVRYQGLFVENFREQVVGKPIAGLTLDKVSGSSLTPKGFNDAVQKIIQQAQM